MLALKGLHVWTNRHGVQECLGAQEMGLPG